MKKLFVTALVLAGLAVASMVVPGFQIKVVETSASACDPATRDC